MIVDMFYSPTAPIQPYPTNYTGPRFDSTEFTVSTTFIDPKFQQAFKKTLNAQRSSRKKKRDRNPLTKGRW